MDPEVQRETDRGEFSDCLPLGLGIGLRLGLSRLGVASAVFVARLGRWNHPIPVWTRLYWSFSGDDDC